MAVSASRYSPGEYLRRELDRLLVDVSRAVEKFSDDPEESAHFIRTRVKRLSSLSRLVPRGRDWRESFLPPCRELKNLFAGVRDATIVRELTEKYAPGVAHDQRVVVGTWPDLDGAKVLGVAAKAALDEFHDWGEIQHEQMLKRLTDTYRSARKAWKTARCAGARDAVFHDWRRMVKRLLYQSEFLGGQKRMQKLTAKIERLGGILGDLQDVCMARKWIANNRVKFAPGELKKRKICLRRKALRAGEKLFSPKSLDFT